MIFQRTKVYFGDIFIEILIQNVNNIGNQLPYVGLLTHIFWASEIYLSVEKLIIEELNPHIEVLQDFLQDETGEQDVKDEAKTDKMDNDLAQKEAEGDFVINEWIDDQIGDDGEEIGEDMEDALNKVKRGEEIVTEEPIADAMEADTHEAKREGVSYCWRSTSRTEGEWQNIQYSWNG